MHDREYPVLEELIRDQYEEEGITDYWIEPLISCKGGRAVGRISDGDTVLFCCRRGEREVQLTESFVEAGFKRFPVTRFNHLRFLPLIEYHEKFAHIKSIIEPVRPSVTLGRVLSEAGFKQLLITETEKESHVTFFFNGRRSRLFSGQIAEIIPSWRNFERHPEMRSSEIGSSLVKAMDKYDFIIVNFPAGDVIGHLNEMELKIKAAAEIDVALGKVYKQAIALGRTVIITADHGLMERGRNEDGTPSVSHTTAPVPFIVVNSTSDDKNEFVLIRGRNSLLENWVELLFFAPDQPPTSDPQPRSYNSQLGTCILQPIFCSFLPPTCYPQSRFLISTGNVVFYG